jgi:putative SOS response-associated peptidase YedK
MCGRFTLTADPNELHDVFPWLSLPEELSPRFNIAPTQPIAVVPNNGENKLDFFVWGLIPFWADDPKIGNRMINARSETLAEKPSFRNAYRRRRCLVLADGFYEWQRRSKDMPKVPHFVKLKTGESFGFAGLWERWESPDGSEIFSCTIITTKPNELVKPIHNRMPVILSEDAYDLWLDPAERAPKQLNHLLGPYPAERMEAYPVSRTVNNPANDSPECIQPL